MNKRPLLILAFLLVASLSGCSNKCKHTTLVTDAAVAATCTEHGLTEGSHCEKCGEIIVPQETIEPLGHKYVIDERVEATEIENGLTQGVHCERCGDVLVEQKVIDATGYKLSFFVNDSDCGYLSGNTVQYLLPDNQSTEVTAVANLGYKFKNWSNGSTDNPIKLSINQETTLVANFEIDNLELPIMNIFTNERAPIISKEDYVKCEISVSNTDYKYEFNKLTGKIRGRGNSTWGMPKKPYKLKFDNKVDLFGNGEAKTWALIANYCDPSLARNYLAYEMGRLLESDFCTTTQSIDLYLNGEYQGVYLVCEQTEVADNRVEIDESYTDTNTGYLLEMDWTNFSNEGEEDKDWFYINGQPYVIKSPDTESKKFNETFVNYIKNYMTESLAAVNSGNITEVKNYLDLDSFAKTYIVHEMMNCIDVGGVSVYLYKDKNGKLTSGPLWDFDISAGNYNYGIENPATSYSTLWAKEQNVWYRKLLGYQEFKDLVAKYLNDHYLEIVRKINNSLNYLEENKNAFERNFQKWKTLGTYVWPNPQEIVAINSWIGQVEYLREWVLKSLDYIYNYYVNCTDSSYSITFTSNDKCTIQNLNTTSLDTSFVALSNAWSRDASTGELKNDGTGQTVFKVSPVDGYSIDKINVDSSNYSTIIEIDEENHIYQINGITSNLVVSVSLKEDSQDTTPTGYSVTFVKDSGVSIMVYPGKDYTVDGDIVDSTIVEDMSGDGQLNFKVILPAGYAVNQITITGSYKNLKGPDDTGAENVYRVTKIASNLTITITTL